MPPKEENKAMPAGRQEIKLEAKIIPTTIEQEMKTSYIDYAMSVIVGRALPDVRDGLKPVHRRILYTMDELGLQPGKPYKKSARVTGDCLGKYHPHGDMAVYDAMVRMAQNFSLRYLLVDGQGNMGCFTGDTKIRLADGRSLSFIALVEEDKQGKKNYTYTFNPESGKIEIAQIKNPRLTKKEARIIKVILDNGEEIKCTPNHLFMTREGSYKEAQCLRAGQDSLMPLYFRLSIKKDDPNMADYEMVYQPVSDSWEYSHCLADEWNIKNGVYPRSVGRIRHHKDFNKENNSPGNIIRMKWGEHWKAHYEFTSERHKIDGEYRKKLEEGRKRYWSNPENRKAHTERLSKRNKENWQKVEYRVKRIKAIKKLWEDPAYKEFMASESSRRLKRKWQNEDFRKRAGESKSQELKKKWQNKEYVEHMAAVMRKISQRIWTDPAHRDYISKLAKARWEDPAYRNKMSKKAKRQWQDPSYMQYMVDCYKKKWDEDPAFREKFMSVLSENGRKTHYYRFLKVCDNTLRSDGILNESSYEKARCNYGSRRGEGIIRFDKALEKYFKGEIRQLFNVVCDRLRTTLNHKVVKVEFLKEGADAYDLTIEKTHNFALASGIFVHNSVDGDPPAAMRYTEVRLSSIAVEMLADIEKETVDFGPNFDESLTEPLVLPSKFPNLLVNGSSGIAVGMATNIPSHNLQEICEGLIALVDNPARDDTELMKIIKGPDFPTGGFICGRQGIKDAFTTGRGLLTLRARYELERAKGGKEAIVVTEIPYQVNKAELIEQIAERVKEKKITGISDLRDESDREGMRVYIELKRDANREVVLNQLFMRTNMQVTYGVNLVALVNNEPKLLTLKGMMQEFLKHREGIVVRRTKFELKKAQDQAHILEGLLICVQNIDAVVNLIKKSKNPDEAREGLISKFKLSKIQAQAILDMRLQRLTQLERLKIEEEHKALIKLIAELKAILASRKKILEIIKKELLAIKEKYGDKRRTEITGALEEIAVEQLIPEENVAILITRDGYVKRMPVTVFKAQLRGGRGVTGMTTREEDEIENLFVSSTHSFILFFTNRGRVYKLKVYDLPEASRAGKGQAVANVLQVEQGESITAAVPVTSFEEKAFLVMATKAGMIKKVALEDFANIRRTGIIAIKLKEGDELRWVRETDGNQEVILGTQGGLLIRFSEKEVRAMGRSAAGVRGIRLGKKDAVVSMDIIAKGGDLLAISERGFGKCMEISEFSPQKRGGKGHIAIKLRKEDKVARMNIIHPQDELLFVTAKGTMSRQKASGISVQGRYAKGVRIQRVDDEDYIVDLERVITEEEREKAAKAALEEAERKKAEQLEKLKEERGKLPVKRSRRKKFS